MTSSYSLMLTFVLGIPSIPVFVSVSISVPAFPCFPVAPCLFCHKLISVLSKEKELAFSLSIITGLNYWNGLLTFIALKIIFMA